MGDFGIRVSARCQHGPLWKLKARALRMWIYLAMKAQHAPQRMLLADGQRITVARGQWLTSNRKLHKEIGGSLRKVTEDLAELRKAGVITIQAIPRTQTGDGGVPELSTSPRTPKGHADCALASLITVAGVAVSSDPVPQMSTKEERERSPLTRLEEQELLIAERIYAIEGR